MKNFTFTLLAVLLLSATTHSQKMFWTSYFGGENSNGAIIQYDLVTDQLSTKFSLEGSPINGADVFLNTDSWEHPGALMKAQDGFYYGVTTLASIGTTNLDFASSNLAENNANGVLFKIDPSNYNIKILHVFEGRNEFISGNRVKVATDAYENNLSMPVYAPIEVSPGVFYGLTEEGGTSDRGGIYKFEVATGTYSHIASFDKAVHGEGVHSPLVAGDGDNLYGVLKTLNGNNNGYLYKINKATNQLNFVKDLSDATQGILWVINNPRGSLVYNSSLNLLVGVKDRFDENSNWGGGCYAYNITTDKVENRFTITFGDLSVLGSNAVGIVRGANAKYYIITMSSGALDNGTIIEYDFTANVPLKVHDFPAQGANNNRPSGEGLQVIGSKIYGFYQTSGDNGKNAMWSFDYVNQAFNSFLPSNENTFGTGIITSFLFDNGSIIGSSMFGGLGDVGSIFEYNTISQAVTIKKSNQAPKGRNLVGGVYIQDNSLWAITNKGGENATEFYETGGYVKLDLVSDQSEFLGQKFTGSFRNFQQAFQFSGVDVANNKLYQIVDVHQSLARSKTFVQQDLITNQKITLKTIDDAFNTSPIYLAGKVYYGSGTNIEVFNTSTGQFETPSTIAAETANGWVKGGLIKASNNKFYGYPLI
ncbi:Gloeo_Verruco repeat-containing protein [Lutibacter agarilyticus]|uniref:Gloeo_Verruco repeat-containing protein n=1 Tax=Lutibacter agarilyticus TaxID=1109740 RepID=A0A238W5T2_9FLAO|nr:choice-of-anchor tandem repeat GloVer-containing protein [Lutibacter agarilyticus]SNR41674.1 Gloeo_Verruco repeat-containing protein [Lutibacter agarilyticus]